MTDRVRGLMQRGRLTVASIARRAEGSFGSNPVIERTADGVRRSTYGEVVSRSRRLASALRALGVQPGDRVATFGWNTIAHLELYLAVPSMGAILHTLNIRLHEDDVAYIAKHAGDSVIFIDASLAGNLPTLPGVRHEIVMNGDASLRPGALSYEEFLSNGDPEFVFPPLNDDSAAAMCYTSGTTGRPKGVVYSHRSISLYSLMANQPDAFGITERDVVMPVVPMFHANAWGLPYIAAMTGAALVLPGPAPTAGALAELIASERVTTAAAVPTIWQGVLDLEGPVNLSSMREAICGGAAVPEALIRRFDERFAVPIVQGWGMTETSPLALISRPPEAPHDVDGRYLLRATQGRSIPFVDFRLDESAGGELQANGPTIAADYFGSPDGASFTEDGWLRTGDVAEVLEGGYIRLLDRTKDLVKSGGEWISSVELETAVLFHPDVHEAAVVARPDLKWGERPYMFVVARPGATVDVESVRSLLREKFASWWVPDVVEVVESIPKTSVGKLDKVALRRRLETSSD